MNVQEMALSAYGHRGGAPKTARAVEYDLFASITARLRDAVDGGAETYPALMAALLDNRKLWSELAVDLASDGNGLPETLRAQLLGLAAFVLSQTDAVMSRAGSADSLIDVNLSIMRGLSGQGGA